VTFTDSLKKALNGETLNRMLTIVIGFVLIATGIITVSIFFPQRIWIFAIFVGLTIVLFLLTIFRLPAKYERHSFCAFPDESNPAEYWSERYSFLWHTLLVVIALVGFFSGNSREFGLTAENIVANSPVIVVLLGMSIVTKLLKSKLKT